VTTVTSTAAAGGQGRAERGAAAVEFALLLPLLVALLFGFVEFGIAFNTKIQATNAAREGARIAVVGVSNWANPAGSSPAKSFWQIVADRAGLAKSALSSCNVSVSGDTLTVQFDYPVDLVIPFVMNSSGHGHAQAEMRVEQVLVAPPGSGCS
jgi:Flp pilus assembly protein TadG